MTQIEKIRSMISEELPKWDQPSLAVGIVKDGEVLLNDGFGLRDVANNLESNADTMYQIGSCSKAFTAAACAILVDRGLLGWDVPVKKYMSWVEFKDPYTTNHVTVRDLLCHRTGLPRHDAYWIGTDVTRKSMVENLRNMQACWSFRDHWCYQNTCFVLAGMLVETLSGMTWEEFVKKEIFEPLGMTRSNFYIDVIEADENHAAPYDRIIPTDLTGYEQVPFLKLVHENMAEGVGAPFGPAGSIISTINDMLKWVKFNLSDGKVGDKQIISEANMKELHKAQMLLSEPLLFPFPEEDFFSYGLGWFMESYRGHVMVEHGGNINGFSALVTMIPDMDLGIVALANFNDSFNTYATTYEIIDSFMGVENGDWHNRWRGNIAELFGSMPEQMKMMRGEPVPDTTPSHDLADYVGVYNNATYGNLVITLEDDGLHMAYGEGGSPLEHFNYDTFTVASPKHLFSGLNMRFNNDSNGKITNIAFDVVMNPAAEVEIFTKKV